MLHLCLVYYAATGLRSLVSRVAVRIRWFNVRPRSLNLGIASIQCANFQRKNFGVRVFNVLLSRWRTGSTALWSRSSASGRPLRTFQRILAFTSSGKIFAACCIWISIMYTF